MAALYTRPINGQVDADQATAPTGAASTRICGRCRTTRSGSATCLAAWPWRAACRTTAARCCSPRIAPATARWARRSAATAATSSSIPDDGCRILDEYVFLTLWLTENCGRSDGTTHAIRDVSIIDPSPRFTAPFRADSLNKNLWIAGGRYLWKNDKGFAIQSGQRVEADLRQRRRPFHHRDRRAERRDLFGVVRSLQQRRLRARSIDEHRRDVPPAHAAVEPAESLHLGGRDRSGATRAATQPISGSTASRAGGRKARVPGSATCGRRPTAARRGPTSAATCLTSRQRRGDQRWEARGWYRSRAPSCRRTADRRGRGWAANLPYHDRDGSPPWSRRTAIRRYARSRHLVDREALTVIRRRAAPPLFAACPIAGEEWRFL